jgi:hypothetical protein
MPGAVAYGELELIARFKPNEAPWFQGGPIAAVSLESFLPAIGINISFWPDAAFFGFLAGFFESGDAAAAAPPTLFRSASIRSTTFSLRGRSFGVIGLPARFWLIRSTSAVSYWSSNLSGSKLPAFCSTMCLARSSMSLVTLTSWISSKIFRRIPDLVRIAQQRPHQSLVERLKRDDVLAVGQHHAADRDFVHLPDSFAIDREGVMSDLAVRTQVVGADQIGGSISLRSDRRRSGKTLVSARIVEIRRADALRLYEGKLRVGQGLDPFPPCSG